MECVERQYIRKWTERRDAHAHVPCPVKLEPRDMWSTDDVRDRNIQLSWVADAKRRTQRPIITAQHK